jgi:hypothetical protein
MGGETRRSRLIKTIFLCRGVGDEWFEQWIQNPMFMGLNLAITDIGSKKTSNPTLVLLPGFQKGRDIKA